VERALRRRQEMARKLSSRARVWARLGLRGRVTLLFGLAALLLSLSMGGLSYFTIRHFLVGERVSSSVSTTMSDAGSVQSALQATPPEPGQAVGNLDLNPGTNAVILQHGQFYASALGFSADSITPALLAAVRAGVPSSQSFSLQGTPYVAVGVKIPLVHAEFFELFDLSDLRHTLQVLLLALVVAVLITTAVGAALGSSASGRSLRPLTLVSRAATAIAGGQLATRLPEAPSDPDLSGLTSSFNLMVDQLEERIQREARFNSDVSHELRSPLTTLSTSLAVLESHQEELSDPAQRALVLLGDDLRRFQRMVADLLEISRSDTGSADVVLEEVNVGELVRRSVLASSRTLPRYAPPRVTIEPALEHQHLWVDKRRFERIMTNLLENAAFYGGGATRVVTASGPDDPTGSGTVLVSVEDQGPGVPETERAKVFERFYRGHESGRRGRGTGSGLGLSLVAEHVRLNGGKVWAEEAEGGGAKFVVQLPLDVPDVERFDSDAPFDGDEPTGNGHDPAGFA
jgi:signal transduction histidine kinase